jgi:hypothetical protein
MESIYRVLIFRKKTEETGYAATFKKSCMYVKIRMKLEAEHGY